MALVLFVVLVSIAAGGLAYVALQPRIEADKRAVTRRTRYARGGDEKAVLKASRDKLKEQDKRRKNIQSSLKEFESRTRERERRGQKLTLAQSLDQAGLKMTPKAFIWMSVIFSFLIFVVFLLIGLGLAVALGAAVVAALGAPRFLLARLRKRRIDAFIDDFPNAIDLVVRGVKSGLPLNDTLRMVASEAREPVRGEFEKVVEAQKMGISTPEAIERLYRSVPTSDTNFFAIVISIQAQAGGNLGEALGNLSKVLRDRKKMKGKIQAMSMEAKASGAIIGSLPVIVAGLVYLTTPDYISLLFITTTGKIIVAASICWMLIGIFVMKKMIAFDF